MKAEYRALTNTTMELLCLLLILKDIGVEWFNVALNHYNNQSAIQIAYNVWETKSLARIFSMVWHNLREWMGSC